MNNKDLLYSTGSYIQYLVKPVMEKTLENFIYIYNTTYIYN